MAPDDFLPYGRQSIEDDDIVAVVGALSSGWLTTGPKVAEFEEAVAKICGCRYAVAVSSGTAALHATMHSINLGPDQDVILSPLSFVATANAVLYCGGRPVFADVDPQTLLLDPVAVEQLINERTRAIVAVDYAGQPCDYDALQQLADRYQIRLIADACHALGGSYHGQPVGALAELSTFSFHPVKPITTAEGGMVVTDNLELADRMRSFRNHGIGQDHHQRHKANTWIYDMRELGFNYRLSDLQSALGLVQLDRLDSWLEKRRQLAKEYRNCLQAIEQVESLTQLTDRRSGWHLYVIKVPADERQGLFEYLRTARIGVNVHYRPIYQHSYYQQLGYSQNLCPIAEQCYQQILSLPLFPEMQLADVHRVCEQVAEYFWARGRA